MLTFAVSTPRCIELDKNKFIALDDLVKVLGSEHADALVLGHLGAQAKRGYGKQTDQTLHLSLFVTEVLSDRLAGENSLQLPLVASRERDTSA